MRKYNFKPAERYAVYKTHGDRCYICRELIDMTTFQVDHIIPESLSENPVELRRIINLLGRPDEFDVNSFENWLPACGSCNKAKGARPWEPSLLVQLALQQASEHAEAARTVACKVVSTRELSRAVNVLQRGAEQGFLTAGMKQLLVPLTKDYAVGRSAESDRDMVRLAPDYAVSLYEILSDDGLIQIVRGPYGEGGGPSDRDREVSPRMRCGTCGLQYFNGPRCVVCGVMDDD